MLCAQSDRKPYRCWKLYDESATDEEKRSAFDTMLRATRLPSSGAYDDVLCHLAIQNARRIVAFSARQQQDTSFEPLQHMEHSVSSTMACVNVYRLAKIDEYVEAISADTAEEWFRVIKRCAATRSTDKATFASFFEFLARLSGKPASWPVK